MEWHEILAWTIIAAAFVAIIVWLVRKIICPSSRCEGCDKECSFRKKINIK